MSTCAPASFRIGVNYWPRSKAMYWWKAFDAAEVDEEFAQIAAWEISHVRFFLLWEDFQPAPDQVSRRQLENLVTVLDIAQKHQLRATPTLLVGNMSGVLWLPRWSFSDLAEERPVLQLSEGQYVYKKVRPLFESPSMLRAQTVLAQGAASAIAGHPALDSWDIANEIDEVCEPSGPDEGRLWGWSVSQGIRSASSGTPVTYGARGRSLTSRGLTIPALAPSLDYLSVHGYPFYGDVARSALDPEYVPFVTILTSQLGCKPTLMQEFGVCTAPPGQATETIADCFLGKEKNQILASEEAAGEYYAQVLDRLWQVGSTGAVAWIYSDYVERLWDKPPFDRARRERSFGIFRADGSPKPAASVIQQFAKDLKSGSLIRRLGPHGSGKISLSVNPDEYYRDPAASCRAAYAEYLEKLPSA